MVKLFLPHRRRNTDGGGGGATVSSPNPAMYLRRGSDGSAAACPSRLLPPPASSLLVDPVLAEAMAGVIKGMQKPSKLSSDHFEAALGIVAIGADTFGEQAFLISNSGSDRKFCASVISRWAESCRATSNRKAAASPLPSKVVADLLLKAAGPRSCRAYPGQSDGIERQLEFALQPGEPSVCGEVLGGSSSERHFGMVASALLRALRGRGWEYGNGNLNDRNMNNDVSSSSGGGDWGTGVSETWATASEESATRSAVAEARTRPKTFSFSTACASSFSASVAASIPPSPPVSASSSSHSPFMTDTRATGSSFSSLEDYRRHHGLPGHHGNRGVQEPPSPPRLFVAENSVSRLVARAVKAEKESSVFGASVERLSGQLRDVEGQLKASESRSAAYASELERVRGQLAAAKEEAAACKENLKEACSYIRKLAAEKKNTDKLVAACHVRAKSLEDNVMAAVLQLESSGAGAAENTAASSSDDEDFHDSIEAEGEKKTAGDKNAPMRDLSLRIAVRSDVSSARRRALRGNAASSCPDSDPSSLSSSSCTSAAGSGVGGGRHSAVTPERKAALDAAFSALARKAGVDAWAVRAEVLSDIDAARRAKASAHGVCPDCGGSGAGSDGCVGVDIEMIPPGGALGSREVGSAEATLRGAVTALPRQFKKGQPPVPQRCGSQSSLFLSPPSLHGTPVNSPTGVTVHGGVTKRNVSAAEDDDVKRLPSTGNCGKRGPSIVERLRAAAAAPANRLTAATRRGFGGTPFSSPKPVVQGDRASEETDPSVLLESPHRGGGGARAAAVPAIGGGGEAGNHAAATAAVDKKLPEMNATKKKPFRFYPFRHSLLYPDSTAADVNGGGPSTDAADGDGNSVGSAGGYGAWRTLENAEGERARSLFLRRHELGFLKDVGVLPRFRKVGAAERVGCGIVGEVFFLEFDDPAQKRAVREFTSGGGLVAKRVYQNATEFGKTSFAREVEILSSFLSPGCHENIIMYLSVNPGAVVMEAMAFDLQALLMDKRKLAALPRTQRMSLVADAVRGLSYLHRHASITHGDVKAANMMVNGPCTVLKLCDFGLAGRSHKDRVMGCTPLYAAPEVIAGVVTASPAVMRPSMDTYSVGLVALQVLDLADEPRTSRFADELDGQPAKMCDLRDTLLEPWLWDARGGLCFEDEVTKLMMAWLSKFPPHRPPLGTLERALEDGRLWSRASPEQQRRKLEQRRQDELEMW